MPLQMTPGTPAALVRAGAPLAVQTPRRPRQPRRTAGAVTEAAAGMEVGARAVARAGPGRTRAAVVVTVRLRMVRRGQTPRRPLAPLAVQANVTEIETGTGEATVAAVAVAAAVAEAARRMPMTPRLQRCAPPPRLARRTTGSRWRGDRSEKPPLRMKPRHRARRGARRGARHRARGKARGGDPHRVLRGEGRQGA